MHFHAPIQTLTTGYANISIFSYRLYVSMRIVALPLANVGLLFKKLLAYVAKKIPIAANVLNKFINLRSI